MLEQSFLLMIWLNTLHIRAKVIDDMKIIKLQVAQKNIQNNGVQFYRNQMFHLLYTQHLWNQLLIIVTNWLPAQGCARV